MPARLRPIGARLAACTWLVLASVVSLAGAAAAAGPAGSGGTTVVSSPGGGTVRLYHREWGSGPPVVLLHGLGASSYSWRLVAPKLAAAGHRVIALDLKGFGRSAKPRDGRYGVIEHAALVRAFLAARGLSGVTLIGHSLGGSIALAVALAEPGKGTVERLVLVATPAYPQDIPPPIAVIQRPGLGEAILAATPPELVARLTLRGASLSSRHITEEKIRAYAAPLREPGARQALVDTARGLDPAGLEHLIRGYRRLAQPTLLLWCRLDEIVPLTTGVRLSRTMAAARLEVLDGCNHLPMEELPVLTSRRLLGFLARSR
jgi:pimeloyl-ACP methyl ester carboxylesterase